MSSLLRFCGALAATLMLGLAFSVSQPVQAQTGSVVISEFRFRGSAGGNDEFIEIYNNTGSDITVSTSDGSAGWAVVGANTAATPAIAARFVIPNGTIIPARGHYLATNSGAAGYSLGGYPAGGTNAAPTGATGNITYATGVVDGGSIGLFMTSTAANFTPANRLDAVGFTAPAGGTASFVEGGGLTPAAGITVNGEYSFMRRLTNGVAQDTDNNQNDFDFVSTTGGTFSTRVSILGAPGPENLSSPVQRNAAIKTSLVNGSVSAAASPNRVRSSAGANPTNAAFGTLSIQRRFTNNTPDPITRLRFRAVDLTALNTPVVVAPQADLRVLSSTGTVTDSQGNVVITVTGLTLETPPAQAVGGGLNSSLTVALPGGSLAPGATLDVQFLLGVQAEGNFRFFVNVEAVPATSGTPTATGATKVQARSKAHADGNK